MWSDTIANFCTIIRNAYLVKKTEVSIPYAKLTESLAKILVREGYLKNSKFKIPNSKFKILAVELKYDEEGNPAISEIQRISKPGMRVYKNAKKIPKVLSGLGMAIISTPQGLLTDKEARKQHLGGEVICQVW